MKGLLHFQNINFENKPDNGHGNHLAQWNIHLGLALWGDLILLKNLPHVDFCLVLHRSNCHVKGQLILLHLSCQA